MTTPDLKARARELFEKEFVFNYPAEDAVAVQKLIDSFKNFLDSLIDDLANEVRQETLEEAEKIVNDNTPRHLTREYRDTDAMRDKINAVLRSARDPSPKATEKKCEHDPCFCSPRIRENARYCHNCDQDLKAS